MMRRASLRLVNRCSLRHSSRGRVADAILAAHLAGRRPGRVLLQNLDDLLFGESALTHVRLPKERTLPKTGGVYGERVDFYPLNCPINRLWMMRLLLH